MWKTLNKYEERKRMNILFIVIVIISVPLIVLRDIERTQGFLWNKKTAAIIFIILSILVTTWWFELLLGRSYNK